MPQRVHSMLRALFASLLVATLATSACAQEAEPEMFERINRRGAVNIKTDYDATNAKIPLDEVHALLPRDAIPALMSPALESVDEAKAWLKAGDRIIEVGAGGVVVGVPVRILMYHEIANLDLGGEPMAATYCPLCDSATVFSRRVRMPGGKTEVLEFGVSGALYNSNVLMYDRAHKGLWSQLMMRAVTGPMSGTALTTQPVRIVRFDNFADAYPDAKLVSRETGHSRNYEGANPYVEYFGSDRLMVPVRSFGDAMKKKTLGLGIEHEGEAWFVPVDAIDREMTVETKAGGVRFSADDAGVHVIEVPDDVRTAQSYYYSWTAFYPNSTIVEKREPATPVAWYEEEIRAFEAADRASPPEPGQVLFIGSSSIRMWETLERDMSPVPVLRRGFGGSKTGEVLAVFDRIVTPYDPSVIVYYCGDNDLGNDNTDAQAAADGFIAFERRARAQWPKVTVMYIAIKPSLARWDNWPAMQRANQIVRDYCNATQRAEFLDIVSPGLTAAGTPDPAMFLDDGLHLNSTGYERWNEVIRPKVLEAWEHR